MNRFAVAVAALAALVPPAVAAPTRSSPLALADETTAFVVNPDAGSVARLDFSGMTGTLTHEQPVGAYPRTLALAGSFVFTADQKADGVSRRDQADLGNLQQANLGHGCNPYGIAPTPDGAGVVVACQGTSELVLLDLSLAVQGRVDLTWPNARAIAVSSDGGRAYVTHYLTEEPGTDGHVSVVDLANKSVATVFDVSVDTSTCETQNSGQGVLNLLSAIALVPDGAPAEVAGQLWVGGTQENNVSKGLFKRDAGFKAMAGAGMFPLALYEAFPDGGVNRNVYRASFHDITRFGIVKLNAADGTRVGKIDIDEANNATDIEFSADGTVAYVVDLMFNSYHVFNTRRGQGDNPTTLFAAVSQFGPGGANPTQPCVQDALRAVSSEEQFRLAPQAQITPIDGYDPVRDDGGTFTVVDTGVEFDGAAYFDTGVSQMKPVPDAIGTAPIAVRVSPSGERVYVANYLSRNVVVAAGALPTDVNGRPANLRCASTPTQTCARNNDCPAGVGFCNHPGGAACTADADCGALGPCIQSADCVPLLLGDAVSSIQGGIAADVLPPDVLDGKILFNTAARDASVTNRVGLGAPAPLFNRTAAVCADNPGQPCSADDQCAGGDCRATTLPNEVTSTSHDASYVTCSTCHADFGGQDGRTWDFAQFGASLRNTMDLRGRAGFAPGTCDGGPNDGQECTFDASCGAGAFCKAQPANVPPNVQGPDRARWFNPMMTVHWNGDRDEVEDFEHTFRQLQGAGDCDAAEDTSTCQGALVQNSKLTSTDPVQINPDLGPPNRNIRGPLSGKVVSKRLTNMADFVYSLTDFVKNPNQPTEASERGRALFSDPATQCADCHNGGPGPGRQFFTDKRPSPDFDTAQPGRADRNNPFIRHDVNTANLFDQTDPLAVATTNQIFQNPRIPIPGSRGSLGDYITPVLNDLWNSAPYLHDGSAHTLLDVIRPCSTAEDDCLQFGRGRNLDARHGITHILTPQQLNDLTAFQNSLSLTTSLSPRASVVKAGTLDLKKAVLTFPKTRKGARPAARSRSGRFQLAGTLRGLPADAAGGVRLTLATPDDGVMSLVERSFTMRARGRRFTGKSTEGGKVTLKLTQRGDGSFAFSAKGKGVDLAALETGNPDLTVALELGDAQFVKNRNLVAKKNVRRLPRRRR